MSEYENKVAVITGGANGIGKCIAEEFTKAGAKVSVIDIAKEGKHFVGDISNKKVLEEYVEYIVDWFGHIDYLINNALPLMKGINECTYEEFQKRYGSRCDSAILPVKAIYAILQQRRLYHQYLIFKG